MNSVHVIGHGAIGSLILANGIMQGLNVSAEARNQGGFTHTVIARCGEKIALPEPKSPEYRPEKGAIIFLPVKAYQVEQALNALSDRIDDSHTLVLVHNGMANSAQLNARIKNQPVYFATSSHAAKKQGHIVEITGKGETQFGPFNMLALSAQTAKDNLQVILDAVLPPATYHANIEYAIWLKLAINSIINPLTALHKVPNGDLLQDRFADTIDKLLFELLAVIQAKRLPITKSLLRKRLKQVIEHTARNHSSMYQDIQLGRRTEIDAINGFIVQTGNELGIEVGTHAELVNQIKRIETGE